MNGTQLVFLGVGAIILISALLVVTSRNLIHAALWLIVTLFGVAILFALLNAGFLAIVQVVIYIGAIAILFIFAVMLTHKDMRDRGRQLNRAWWLSAIVAALSFGGLVWMLQGWSGFDKSAAALPADFDAVGSLGNALIAPDAFVLPFEVASVLLLAALIGAVYVAFTRK
ncbi:MAG: NADH-quinone oxidoreductase subunit J [Chloroflexota bacterium]